MGRDFRDRRSGGGQDGRRSGGRDFGNRSFGGGRDRDRQMHDVVCDACGDNCQVPFRPTGDKPVYCSSCFEKKGSTSRDSGRGNKNSGGGQNRGELREISKKLDQIIQILNQTSKSDVKEDSPKKEETKEVVDQPKVKKAVKKTAKKTAEKKEVKKVAKKATKKVVKKTAKKK